MRLVNLDLINLDLIKFYSLGSFNFLAKILGKNSRQYQQLTLIKILINQETHNKKPPSYDGF